jgi:hypothetical protein
LIVAPIRNVETSADAGRTAARPQPEGIRIATPGVTGRCSNGHHVRADGNRQLLHFGERHLCHFFHERHRPQVTVAVPTNSDSGECASARCPAGRHDYVERADVIFARARVLQTRLGAPQLPCGGAATRGLAARDYARWAHHLWAGVGGRGDRLRSQELVRAPPVPGSHARAQVCSPSRISVYEGVMPVGSRLTAKVRGPAGMFGFRDPAALCQ